MAVSPKSPVDSSPRVEHAKRRTLRKILVLVGIMFAFGFAMIPFYRKICEVTGVNAMGQPSEAAVAAKGSNSVNLARTIVLQLDANQREKDWVFRPLTTQRVIHPGELIKLEYLVENRTSRRIKAQAIPSYSPSYAGKYFQKLDCFCFQQQTFEPNEVKRLPVILRVDPALPEDVKVLTLSYTLFRVEGV